jgi:hypothetical protein
MNFSNLPDPSSRTTFSAAISKVNNENSVFMLISLLLTHFLHSIENMNSVCIDILHFMA